MIPDKHDLLSCALDAAHLAASLLKSGYGKTCKIYTKSTRHDLVTEYDKKSEEVILAHIAAKYPHHSFLSEESGWTPPADKTSKDTVTWIIDPLDGTVNFAHSIPVFSISIAACYEGKVYCGVVVQPLLNEVFHAVQGGGAFLNGNRISTSTLNVLDDSFLATGFPYNTRENPKSCIDRFATIAKHGMPIRRLGSAALDLCYVAAGRFDAYWEIELQPWDFAAGLLIVEEAGGKVTDYAGNKTSCTSVQEILATNGPLHNSMTNILSRSLS